MAWGAEPLSYTALRVQGCFLWQWALVPNLLKSSQCAELGAQGQENGSGLTQTASLYPEATRKSPLVAFLTIQEFSNLPHLIQCK